MVLKGIGNGDLVPQVEIRGELSPVIGKEGEGARARTAALVDERGKEKERPKTIEDV